MTDNNNSAPERFTKKPVTIDAIQWTGKNREAVQSFLTTTAHAANGWVKGDYVEIGTLEGLMIASVGDWIIRGVKGEHYPCKPDIFEATYQPADLCAADRGVAETCPDCKGLGRWGFADGGDTCEQCSGRGTIAALQPTEAQPVAWAEIDADVIYAIGLHKSDKLTTPLYATPPTDSTSLVSGVQRYKPNGFGMVPSLDGVWIDYRDVVALARREAPPAVTVEDCIKAVEALTPTRFNIGGPQLISRKRVIAALRALEGSN